MRFSRPTTLSDVAVRAGVSTMTASFIINGGRSMTRVSDATRKRVFEIAELMRYVPNELARSLRQRRMNAIGIACAVDSGHLNLYYLELLNGILRVAAQFRQRTVLCCTPNLHGESESLAGYCDRSVDGMILIGPSVSEPQLNELCRTTRIVTIHANYDVSNAQQIDIDNTSAARSAVKHLIDMGHTRIAHITGDMERRDAQERLNGYRYALEEAAIPFDRSLVFLSGFTEDGGLGAGRRIVEQFGSYDLPTAVFCANDAIACGCMEGLSENGLKVPEQISVVGFDDLEISRTARPQLTTVRQPLRQMGARAVEALLHMVGDDETGGDMRQAPEKIIFDTELVLRDSVDNRPQRAAQPQRCRRSQVYQTGRRARSSGQADVGILPQP